ncbi:MAG: tetratricopeptide repeat protein, partial [Gammaproteobacteria bacterium]
MKNTVLMQSLFIALACAAALLAYQPGFTGGFALDDYTNIVQNAALHITDLSWAELSRAVFSFQAGPTMRPISMLSFALNGYFFGADNAEAFKVGNVMIHVLNGLLVSILLLQLLQSYRKLLAPSLPERNIEWLALITGALWLLHPLNLMPVLYVVQRETALSSLFILAGCNVYVWSRTLRLTGRGGLWLLWLAVPLLTLIATLCKESGALLPVYTLAIELFIFRFRTRTSETDRVVALFYAVILVLPAFIGLSWMLWGSGGGYLNYMNRNFTLSERLMSEARVVWLYVRWTLFPDLRSLGLYHDDIAISRGLLHPATTLWAIIGLMVMATACVGLARRLPLLVLGIAWFFAGQLMESTIFPLELAYEHRCYLPDLGLILAVMSLVYPLQPTDRFRLPRYALIAGMLCACGCLTWLRAADWKDNLTFSASEARHHPESPYATYM